jgi:alkylation response protein AidB-like acyl-CoA dehydrogenase
MTMLMVVASSDATNLKNTTAVVNGDKIVLSGHKWVSPPDAAPSISETPSENETNQS